MTDLRTRLYDKTMPVTETGCIIWLGYLMQNGYGQIGVNGAIKLAHRAAYELDHGPIPPGMFLCHRCDVPCCVNPKHMFVGTQHDNMQDAMKKGRLKMTFQTHVVCKKGHNDWREMPNQGRRVCAECKRTDSMKKYWKNGKAKRQAINKSLRESESGGD